MRLHALQYLRAIAALAVVYSHSVLQVDAYTPYLLKTGSFGVDIFFVISGFIMVYIARPYDTPHGFFTNRIRRVVPLYWFFTLLMAGILLLMPWAFKNTAFDLNSFWMSLFFVPHWSIVAETREVWPMVAPGWSLVYEMYFYLLFALSLWLPERYRIAAITALIALIFAIASLSYDGQSAVTHFLSRSIVFEFVLGMLLAVAFKRGFSIPSGAAWCLLILGTALFFVRLPGPHIIEYGVPSLLVVTGCLYVSIGEYAWAELLGDASYALYLSHIFVLGVVRKVVPPILGDGPWAAYGFVIISVLVCTVASIVVHQYIDNWLLRRERLGLWHVRKNTNAC